MCVIAQPIKLPTLTLARKATKNYKLKIDLLIENYTLIALVESNRKSIYDFQQKVLKLLLINFLLFFSLHLRRWRAAVT